MKENFVTCVTKFSSSHLRTRNGKATSVTNVSGLLRFARNDFGHKCDQSHFSSAFRDRLEVIRNQWLEGVTTKCVHKARQALDIFCVNAFAITNI